MSGLIGSSFIDAAIRRARRFSSSQTVTTAQTGSASGVVAAPQPPSSSQASFGQQEGRVRTPDIEQDDQHQNSTEYYGSPDIQSELERELMPDGSPSAQAPVHGLPGDTRGPDGVNTLGSDESPDQDGRILDAVDTTVGSVSQTVIPAAHDDDHPTEHDSGETTVSEHGRDIIIPDLESTNTTGGMARPERPHMLESTRTDSAGTQMSLTSFSSMSLDEAPTMTRNQSYDIVQESEHTHETTSASPTRQTVRRHSSLRNVESATDAVPSPTQMSGHLPADDGMKELREKVHQIREMALSNEEKALKMHELMTADYERFKTANKTGETIRLRSLDEDDTTFTVSSLMQDDAALSQDRVARLYISGDKSHQLRSDLPQPSEDDLKPTFQPRRPSTEATASYADEDLIQDIGEHDLDYGCTHYRRNVKVLCGDCGRWYTCRHCHDENEKHKQDRAKVKYMLCMLCGHAQAASDYCTNCKEMTAAYYCDICKLWDNDTSHRIYHCDDCGICRRGQGLGKDYVHCKRCNVCIAIAYANSHRCVERATECDCPICGEWMFTSSRMVVAVRCGHYMHRNCHDALMLTSFKCPICSRSAVNMELQWRKLDHAIEAQPMPAQFVNTKAFISCNDCTARTEAPFHWLGNKCLVCDSYNTNQIKLINGPTDQELQDLDQIPEVRASRAAERALLEQVGTVAEVAISSQSHVPIPNHGHPAQTTDSRHNPSAASITTGNSIGLGRGAVSNQELESLPIPNSSEAEDIDRFPTPTASADIDVAAIIAAAASPPGEGIAVDSETRARYLQSARSPSHRGSSTDDNDINFALEMIDQSSEGSDVEDNLVAHDIGFWGEPVSPRGWSMPSVPAMPSLPRLPSVSIPSMANINFTRAVSPSTFWPTGSPNINGWNLPSPTFFTNRRFSGRVETLATTSGRSHEAGEQEQHHGSGEEEDISASGSDYSDDPRQDRDTEDEGEVEVDRMELFGHR